MERRGCTRVEVSHPVLYRTDVDPRPKVGSTLDLSMEGTRIETPYRLIKGERLEISIAIDPQVIKCRGKVVHIQWSDGERLKAGIRFKELSSHDRLFLGQYVSYVVEKQERVPHSILRQRE